jgi:PleD family two-component response regulator
MRSLHVRSALAPSSSFSRVRVLLLRDACMQRILIVDDSNTIRKMVRASLQSLDEIEFLDAASGLEAIEHLASI